MNAAQRVPIDQVHPMRANARKHNAKNLASIQTSIKRFGQQKPIVVGPDGSILAGNGTWLAAKALGWTEIEVVRSDLAGPEATAYAITDNRTAELAEWDDVILAETLSGLQTTDEALAAATGFSPAEIERLVAQVNGITRQADADAVPDAFAAADKVLRPGAPIYIWHADSEGLVFRQTFEAAGWGMKQCLVWAKQTMVMGRQDYQWRHEPCLYGWKPGAAHPWHSDRRQTTLLKARLDWHLLPQPDGSYTVTIDGHTYQITGTDLAIRRTDTTLLEFDRPSRSTDHPTMKPVALFEYLLVNSTTRGQGVLDPFCGSGTTVIAAERTGRTAYALELSPAYADVIRRRYAEFVHGEGCDWPAKTPAIEREP